MDPGRYACPKHGEKVQPHHDNRGRLRCTRRDCQVHGGVKVMVRCGMQMVKLSLRTKVKS